MKRIIAFVLVFALTAPVFGATWASKIRPDQDQLLSSNWTFDDIANIYMGTDKDFRIECDTTKVLEILPAAGTDDYAVNLGVDQSGVDFKAFAATASRYLWWDASADTLFIAGHLTTSGTVSLNNDAATATTNIGTGTTTGTVTIGGTGAQTINIGNGAAAKTVNLGSTNTTSATNINAGSGGITLTGAVVTSAGIRMQAVPTGRATRAATGQTETISAAADVGMVITCTADNSVITLPPVGTGQTYTIMNMAADGTAKVSLDTNSADKFLGGCGIAACDDGDKISNTKATAKKGDYVTVSYGTADGWYIVDMVGTWVDDGA